MKWLLSFLLLIALPVLAQVPPMPPGISPVKPLSPKHTELLSSLGSPMLKMKIVLRAAPAPAPLRLVWDYTDSYADQPWYPTNYITNIVFEIYYAAFLTDSPPLAHGTDIPNNFHLLGTTPWPNTSYAVFADMAAGFFICRAKDSWTGLYSNWNTK